MADSKVVNKKDSPKTTLHDLFKTDRNKETKGIVLDYGDVKITIARAGGSNKSFAKEMEKLTKPFRRQIQNGTLPDKTADIILKKAYAKHIILDWDGVVDDKDNPIPCTEENIIRLFDDLPDFFNDIQEQSRSASLFRDEEIEESAKN